MSQTPNKQLQKMCKSPKSSSNYQIKQEKIDYENMSTNCTVVGSNNLNLVKKPQLMTNMSPAYSNPSPNYHPQSPYSSPASLKSPSPSLKPPTPQPNFPVMQIIHNNLISRPIQTSQAQNIIKLKPHLNILPKPSASPQPSPKPSVSPQIVIPAGNQTTATATAHLMQSPQPLLLNQMPMLAAPGVQFILRPQTATPMNAGGPKLHQATSQSPHQGLILQPACGTQQLLQLGGPARSQPMMRVLTNGMHLAPATSTTYVTTQMANQPINATHIQQTIVNSQQQAQQQQHIQIQQQVLKKKPKVKVKKKLDLANIMKLSGIGDEDDIQFESDTSQSESEHTSVPTTPQPVHQPPQQVPPASPSPFDPKKNIQNYTTINSATPVVQVLNQNFQGSMISNNPPPTAHQASPFNSTFITPNFTINNGLMLQRSGGFKLTVGEDGRLMLQHDPTLNQDIQSQLILQSLLGLNGGLVLQPSMDQQTVQQTVQTIQQQSVQTIQQQTVQSQTIQTVQQQTVQPQVQHTLQSLQPQIQQQTVQQTIQHQTVNALQQPMQIVQPQPIHSLHSQVPTVHSISQSQVHNLQSQIQSLLAQQNVVQAQAVHQNVPHSVHSQMQSVQNLAQSSVMAQNVQNLAQSSVQNVVAQNMAQSAVLSQNVNQNASVQNVVAQNMAQNMSAAQNSVLSQNMSQNASVQNVMAQNMSQNASVQNVLSQNMSQSASVQNVVAQNMQNIQSVQPTQTQNVSQPSVHTVQGFQQAHTQTSQPILKVQPFQKSQPPVQTVQPIQNLSHQHHHQNMQEQQNQQSGNNNPTSYVVNLTPEQLEQLKRNGQVTVNGQTIFMQRPNKDQNEKKLSPKMKPVKKVSEVHKIQAAPFKPLPSEHHNNAHTDNSAMIDRKPNLATLEHNVKSPPPVAHTIKPMSSPVQPVQQQQQQQPPQKQLHTVLPHSHVQPILPTKQQQPQAMVQPSVQQHQVKMERQKPQMSPKQQKVSPTVHSIQMESGNSGNGATNNHEVDKLLGQILEETHNPDLVHYRNNNAPNNNNNSNGGERQQQRITTIQLTPQKQQHLKTIQMQIQSLTARMQSGDTEGHNTLKHLFAEQHKILATGKLLPPDKVYYLNNQLTIVNPSSLNLPSPASSIKSEPPSPGLPVTVPRSTSSDTTSTVNHQPIATVSQLHQPPPTPRVSVSVSTSTGDLPPIAPTTLPSTIHHHPSPIVTSQQTQHHPAMVTSHVANAQATAQAIHNHQNHVIGQRLGVMGQVPQLPPLYPKPHPIIQHSPKLHSPQMHSPKLHSPKLHSPQLPSPQPAQLQSAVTNQQQQQQLNHVQTVPQAIKPKPQQPVANKATILSQQQQAANQQLFQQHFQQQQLMQQQKEAQRQQLVAQQQKQQQEQQQQQMSLAKKAHLIESQYQLDQQGASKPDLQKPFRDKREACIRLVRYHCYDQPVLSEQDLGKADEIFEVTAKHFIAKYDRMNDKYKYLLMKESMRQVQTSELMMLDRMFLADEQQSLIRLRQDYETELHNLTAPSESSGRHYDSDQERRHGMQNGPTNHEGGEPPMNSEEYDEWACIQRELGYLPPDYKDSNNHHNNHHHHNHHHHHHHSSTPIHQHLHNHMKRTSSSDSRLETLKRFRVDKKKHDASMSPGQSKCGYESATSSQANSSKEEESDCTNNSIDEQVQSAINSILNLQQQQQQSLDLDGLMS